MSIFKKIIEITENKMIEIDKSIIANSHEICNLMELTINDLKKADEYHIVWHLENYFLKPTIYYSELYNGWTYIIQVYPKEIDGVIIGDKYLFGYSNNTIEPPIDWIFFPRGTMTKILYPDCVQEQVKKEITEYILKNKGLTCGL